ncbi:MAG: phasin family protein [Chloroflexota bacterium]
MDESTIETEDFGTPAAGDVNTSPQNTSDDVPRRVFLAGLGAVAEVRDTVERTVDRLIDRGAQAQEDLRERSQEMRRQRSASRNRIRDLFRSTMDGVLDTISVPSKGDMDTINVKLNILTRKIDDLQMQRMDEVDPVTPGSPPGPTTGDLAT